MGITDLPAVNASLNGLATVLLVVGYLLIKRKRIQWHKRVMITAFGVSTAFLICYLIYHLRTPTLTRFSGPAGLKPVYLAILISHTVLAAAVPPLCIYTLVLAWRGRYERHRRIARITLPVWLYVSATGVVIYVLLYQVFTG